jgi:hypothetical protein
MLNTPLRQSIGRAKRPIRRSSGFDMKRNKKRLGPTRAQG